MAAPTSTSNSSTIAATALHHYRGTQLADPELRYTPTGKPVTLLRLASTPRRRDDAGQWVDGTTTFLDAEIWGAPAENAAESLVKGSRVLLTGRIRTDAWTPNEGPLAGVEQRRIRIAVDELAVSIRYAVARSVRPDRSTAAGENGGQDDEANH